MGTSYLTDTNTVIDYLAAKLPASCVAAIDKNIVEISVITRIELLAWPDATPSYLETLDNFIANSRVHVLDEPTILKAIEIRKTKRWWQVYGHYS